LKLITTATCYASGNAGGIFGPSLFIGAMLGGAFGGSAHLLFPDYTGGAGAYALVGMGVAFAGIIRVPLTSVIMIFEVTRDYSIIVPLMVSNLVSYFVSMRLQREPIYEALLHQDGIYLPPGAGAREDFIVVAEGSRPPERVIVASETVEQALLGSDPAEGAWPVVDEQGLLLGMVTRAQLEGAAADGRSAAAVSELVERASAEANGSFPQLHVDDPLDTAFRRMAQHGLSVLPVVSRTNVRRLVGTIALRDALAAYGLEERRHAEAPASQTHRGTDLRGLVGAVVGLVGLLGLAAMGTFYYRSERASRAQRSFESANELMQADRYAEAIERYRSALSISRSLQHRLALGLALVKSGQFGEAEIYLRDVLEEDAQSGPAHLGLARVEAQAGEASTPVSQYRLALASTWPVGSEEDRAEAQVELVELLARAGRPAEAKAELLQLRKDVPEDAALENRVARLLLEQDLPKEAAAVLGRVLRRDPRDASAHALLGVAELDRRRYEAAREAFETALQLDPHDAESAAHLRLAEKLQVLDPDRPGLRRSERYGRSRELLAAALAAADGCLASSGRVPSPEFNSDSAAAREAIGGKREPRSRGDAADRNLGLAERLWMERASICGPGDAGDPVQVILRRRWSRRGAGGARPGA
jgi:tetratricopeptide (TPR) repeat protein